MASLDEPSSPRTTRAKHVCPDCSKSYQAAEALNRHRKNHAAATHVCNICQAHFRRKDLLRRHIGIHAQAATDGNVAKGRRRSRHACVRCSQMKVRCDNSVPCSRCRDGSHECIYHNRARSDRLDGPSSRANSPRNLTTEAGYVDQSDSMIELYQSQGAVTAPERTMLDVSGGLTFPQITNYGQGPSLPPAEASWPQNTGWPWLHEGLFLQDDPVFDLFDPVRLPAAANFGVMPDYQRPLELLAEEQSLLPYQQTPLESASYMPLLNADLQMQALSSAADQAIYQSSGEPPTSSHTEAARPFTTTLDDDKLREQTVAWVVKAGVDLCRLETSVDEGLLLWRRCSEKIEVVFGLQSLLSQIPQSNHILEHFITLFIRNFHVLWPTLWKQELDALHPFLYLTVSAVGAAYASQAAFKYHVQALDAIRVELLTASFQHQLPESADEPLCRSLLIIQAATLYLTHRNAFSTAHQLSGIIVPLARKINVFSDGPESDQQWWARQGSERPREMLYQLWAQREGRKKIAHGVLRLEALVSALLGTRPLISFEEVNLHMPCAAEWWNDADPSRKFFVKGDLRTPYSAEHPHFVFSDLVHIILDRNEQLPNLRLQDLEAILFGLQQHVWSCSHDRDKLHRLTAGLQGSHQPAAPPDLLRGHLSRQIPGTISTAATASPINAESDDWQTSQHGPVGLISPSERRMTDLRNERNRVMSALEKWKLAVIASTATTDIRNQRSTLLSSYLLYHLSLVRMNADVPALHRTFIEMFKDREGRNDASLAAIHSWAETHEARSAAEHSCSVYSLIAAELHRPPSARACFNILSHLALFHAAAVIWAYAGVYTNPCAVVLDVRKVEYATEAVPLCRTENYTLMDAIARLMQDISTAHTSTLSFSNTVAEMAKRPMVRRTLAEEGLSRDNFSCR